jgi:hypothetical protein
MVAGTSTRRQIGGRTPFSVILSCQVEAGVLVARPATRVFLPVQKSRRLMVCYDSDAM